MAPERRIPRIAIKLIEQLAPGSYACDRNRPFTHRSFAGFVSRRLISNIRVSLVVLAVFFVAERTVYRRLVLIRVATRARVRRLLCRGMQSGFVRTLRSGFVR